MRRLKSALSRSAKTAKSPRAIHEESVARYCPGGYHPVRIGDVFNNGKYKIVSKLGYGVSSTVWLARNLETKRHVALKVLTADSFGNGNDTLELEILMRLKACAAASPTSPPPLPGAAHVLGLLDQFEHRGPHGNHVCLVVKATGPDLSRFRRLFPGLRLPPPLVKSVSRQLLLALAHLHDTCQVIHADIKPTNILVESPAINDMFENAPSEAFSPQDPPLPPPQNFYMRSTQVSSRQEDLARSAELSVRLTDFGTSSRFDKHLTEWIQPDMLRAPEVILGAQWDRKVDIWNLGLIIWELAEGRLLFDGMWASRDSYTSEAHLAQMTAVLGAFPERLLARSRNRDRYFDSEGNLTKPSTFPPVSLEQFSKNPNISASDRTGFLELVAAMTRIDPEQRPEARTLAEADWLKEALS
ncbi:Serine/threonine-protein kinase SRPK [Colletotrichum tanaceti]|uniref:non-specific serine/threonine protein kinase n=1 Tax=Colletotrichum tanaceti TaxID=1306861 RepID=A0A4U6X4W9_9PEZI|nr:Serine/threonine-protein kinase SRPK [Colletotrichum tanaceti]TKW48407.1 Serine/threonine-protein kinase SRPK [Colletotrichum tanaceti]